MYIVAMLHELHLYCNKSYRVATKYMHV